MTLPGFSPPRRVWRACQEGFRFFQFALCWHYGFGEQVPGRTSIWDLFQTAAANMPPVSPAEGGISDPQGLREHLSKFEACGVDQVAFIQQAGRNQHEHICEELELFAGEVMPEFKARFPVFSIISVR